MKKFITILLILSVITGCATTTVKKRSNHRPNLYGNKFTNTDYNNATIIYNYRDNNSQSDYDMYIRNTHRGQYLLDRIDYGCVNPGCN